MAHVPQNDIVLSHSKLEYRLTVWGTWEHSIAMFRANTYRVLINIQSFNSFIYKYHHILKKNTVTRSKYVVNKLMFHLYRNRLLFISQYNAKQNRQYLLSMLNGQYIYDKPWYMNCDVMIIYLAVIRHSDLKPIVVKHMFQCQDGLQVWTFPLDAFW